MVEKVTIRDWKAKASQYLRRMKEGEQFEVNGLLVGNVDHIHNVDHIEGAKNDSKGENVDHVPKDQQVEAKSKVFTERNKANWEEVNGERRWTKAYQAELDRLDAEILELWRSMFPGYKIPYPTR